MLDRSQTAPGVLAGFLVLAISGPALGGAVQDDGVAVVGPGPAQADQFHPDRDLEHEKLFGGRVIVHLTSLPENMNYVVENSAVTRRMLYEVHETLLIQDWEYHEYRPRVAKSWVEEDLVVLKDSVRDKYANTPGVVDAKVRRSGKIEEGQERHRAVLAVYGKTSESGDVILVEPVSRGSALSSAREIPAADVDIIERGSVFTFELRDDVLWHPSVVFEETHPEKARALAGHKVDARDVYFSWTVYNNPDVDCDEKRFQFIKVTKGEIVDPLTVRFFYESQYAFARGALGDSLTILPSHVYDLADPDNPDNKLEVDDEGVVKERFTAEEQAKHINENPHNQLWVGVGPYRVTAWDQQYVEAERFTDGEGKCLYFDRENAGYVDTIRWRYIGDDETAMNALLNGELDYFERIKSADYFGERTAGEDFAAEYYKGYKYLGTYGYTGWNMYRPQLKELAVRKAIAMAIDLEEYLQTNYRGLARQVSGPFPYNSAAYDHSVKPFTYDVDEAIDLLEEAEWYDRDGDGIRDKNGNPLKIDFLMPSGNDASKNFGLKLQESLAELEIEVNIVQKEWATFLEDFKARNFDCANLAWVPSLESDPEQLWHSDYGKYEVRGSNNSGVMDPELDALILEGQRELDREKRMMVWNKMHRRIYEDIQPYLFMYNVPNKFGMSRRLRGFQTVAIDPGYVIRRWYFWDPEEPGTRKTLDR